jgi:hypothetical protein
MILTSSNEANASNKANETDKADKAIVADAAADVTDAAEADEADLANKATDTTEANQANKAEEAIATKEVNKAVEPIFSQGQQVDDANDATANKTNEAIGAGVSIEAVDSDDEDGVLDNQLAEHEKLDVAKGHHE